MCVLFYLSFLGLHYLAPNYTLTFCETSYSLTIAALCYRLGAIACALVATTTFGVWSIRVMLGRQPAAVPARRLGKPIIRGFVAVSLLDLLFLGIATSAPTDPLLHPTCERHLKQLRFVCFLFADDSNGGYFPELSLHGPLRFSLDAPGHPRLVSEYLGNSTLLFCPNSGCARDLPLMSRELKDIQTCLERSDYLYTGYALTSDEDVHAFAAACEERRQQGLRFNQDLLVDSGKRTLYRLCMGVERKILPDASEAERADLAKTIPVFIERPGNHKSCLTGRILPGGNVAFLDGHVEWRSAGKWPYTDTTIQLLAQFK
jgi:prepilin-type processing-associated H-X9-DG protein